MCFQGKEIVVNVGKRVFCNPGNIPVANLDGCNHEEADTKGFLHANDAALSGHSSLMMLTVDSDWVVLAPRAMDYISRHGLRELCIGFGHRANRNNISCFFKQLL